jgi:DNA-binding NtrC family response regulator
MALKQFGRPVMLLVDDDEVFRTLAEAHFSRAGFDIVATADALAALDAVDKMATLDCLVSDIWLPTGTPHGVALANMVTMRFPRVVRVFVSGDPKARDHVGTASIFTKPVDFAALVEALREQLKKVPQK